MYPRPSIVSAEPGTAGLARVARFAAEVTIDDIPAAALDRARQTLIDTIAVAAGGAKTLSAKTARKAISPASDPRPDALSPPDLAFEAFTSAISASALDFDDGHYAGGAIHPGAVIIPPLLVYACTQRVSVSELLLAQIAGYEVALRAARLAWPQAGGRYHCTGSAGAVGAAVACAKLAGADEEELERAISIAWAHAPMAPLQFPMVKEAIGWGAHAGYFAFHLAMTGFKALPVGIDPPADPDVFPPTPFDEPQADGDQFLDSLGRVYEAEFNYFKPFAACRYTHTALTSLKEMLDEGLNVDEIESIEVGTHGGAQFLTYQEPPSLEHAQYSYPFVLACMAEYGDAGVDQVCESNLGNERLLELAEKVTVTYDAEIDSRFPEHYGTVLKVRLKGGEVEKRQRLTAPGDTEEPLSETWWMAKLNSLLDTHTGPGAEQLITALSSEEPEGGTELARTFRELVQGKGRS